MKIQPYKIENGGILDIENNIGYELNEKLEILRKNKEWMCLDKWERLKEDKKKWRTNIPRLEGSYAPILISNSSLESYDVLLSKTCFGFCFSSCHH